MTRWLPFALAVMVCAPALYAQGRDAIAEHHSSPDTLVVATYAYGMVDRAGAVQPLADEIARALRRPTRVTVAPDPVALLDLARAGKVDVIVTNTFGYLLLADGKSPAGAAIATFRVPHGARTNYSAVLVTTRAAVAGLDDVVRQASSLRVALVSAGSTTGNLVPRLALAAHRLDDLETQVATVAYAGTHAGAFAALRDGHADVAGLAREEFERQLEHASPRQRARYRVLWSSPDIMLGPVAVRRGISRTLRDSVAAVVVGLESRAPAAFAALRGGWTEARVSDGLIAAEDGTYDVVRQLFGRSDAVAGVLRRLMR